MNGLEDEVNPARLEALLLEDESAYLDFKSDQYPFEGASDDEKSELLKDIVAFANAWRRTDAFILIGVQEVVGGRSRPVGVREHLDDAKLQQFVRGKVQRPITFSYEAQEIDGVSIGIISVPVQERPFFLTKDYGRLKKHVVYVRRGSSTDQATPDEVARMGLAIGAEVRTPAPRVAFARLPERKGLGRDLKVQSVCINPIPRGSIRPAPAGRYPGHLVNRDFMKDLVEWYTQVAPLSSVGFVVSNDSPTAAQNVQIRFSIPADPVVVLFDEEDLPERPHWDIVSNIVPLQHLARERFDVLAKQHGDHWEVTVHVGNVHPRATLWTKSELHIGAHDDVELSAEALIYADNLPEPVVVPLTLAVEVTHRDLMEEDLRPYLDEELA